MIFECIRQKNNYLGLPTKADSLFALGARKERT